MIEHITMMQIPYHDIWSILLFSEQVPHCDTSNSGHCLFWNFEDPVLVQIRSYTIGKR